MVWRDGDGIQLARYKRLSQIVNSWPNRKLLDYKYAEQIMDMLPQIGLSLFMGVIVYCVRFLSLNDLLALLIQVLLGAGN